MKRINPMSTRFIGLIAAASIAITAIGAAPARADEDDVARALAVILGLAVIGSSFFLTSLQQPFRRSNR